MPDPDLPPPSPAGGEVRFEVTCRTGRGRGRVHEVAIAADWTVDTGHDLDAERVAASFGATLSCLDVVDKLVPAARHGLGLWLRRIGPSMLRGPHGWVVTDQVDRCACSRSRAQTGLSLMSAGTAAGHERGVEHLARKFGTDKRQLSTLRLVLDREHGGFDQPPSDHPARSLVVETYGLADLWDAGIHPDSVVAIHELLWPAQGAVPAHAYLAYGTDRRPEDWGPWISLGLPVLDVERLTQSDYRLEDVQALATATGRTPRQVAVHVAAWLRADCRPALEDLEHLLRGRHGEFTVPSAGAVSQVVSQLSFAPGRTEVGLVLALTRSTRVAIRCFREGRRTPQDALFYMSEKGLL